jgi:hypothetical protein
MSTEPRVVETRARSLKGLTPESFKDFLLDNALSDGYVLNGWSRTLYQALAVTEWFICADFNDPNWPLW